MTQTKGQNNPETNSNKMKIYDSMTNNSTVLKKLNDLKRKQVINYKEGREKQRSICHWKRRSNNTS